MLLYAVISFCEVVVGQNGTEKDHSGNGPFSCSKKILNGTIFDNFKKVPALHAECIV